MHGENRRRAERYHRETSAGGNQTRRFGG